LCLQVLIGCLLVRGWCCDGAWLVLSWCWLALRWCCAGAWLALRWCLVGVALALRWCLAGAVMVLGWCCAGARLVLRWCSVGVALVLGWCCAGARWYRSGAWLVLIMVVPVLISPLLSPSCVSSNRVNFRVPCLIDRIFALSNCLIKFTLRGLLIFPARC